MPAKSKSQQRFFGMVRSVQKGGPSPSPEVARAAETMSAKDVRDFAKTKHDKLPEKKSMDGHCAADGRKKKQLQTLAKKAMQAHLAGLLAVRRSKSQVKQANHRDLVVISRELASGTSLSGAVAKAYPRLSKQAHAAIEKLLVRGCKNALARKIAEAASSAPAVKTAPSKSKSVPAPGGFQIGKAFADTSILRRDRRS